MTKKKNRELIKFIGECDFAYTESETYHITFLDSLDLWTWEENDIFCGHHYSLDIWVVGKTKDELVQDFLESLVYDWKIYVDSDISTLAADAIDARKILKQVIKVEVKNGK